MVFEADVIINRMGLPSPTRNSPWVPLPEEKLSDVAFRTALIYKVVSGLGKLALIWATVVLLGGFSTLIKSVDFWVVTVIVFVEAMRIFSTLEEPDEQFLIRAPGAMRNTRTTKPNSCRFFLASIIPAIFMIGQIAVVTTSIALSLWRLIKQDYVDPPLPGCKEDHCKDDHKNIKVSLNIFYGLVVAQGIIFSANLANPMVKQMKNICREYELDRSLVLPLLTRYMLDNYMKCVTGEVRGALSNDLVTYTMELVRSSDLAEDQHTGVQILDQLLLNKDYQKHAFMKLQASAGTIGRIVYMLGSNSLEEEDTKHHAAQVLLKLAPHLLVENFPGMLQLVSSNLKKDVAAGHVNFTLLSFQILSMLADNADNCWYIAHTASYLLPNIIGRLTNCADENVVEASVTVLHKLARSAGEAGDALRCSISKDVYILSSITDILEEPKLQAEALGLLACLALDKASREDICTSRRIIKKILDILLVEAKEISEEDSSRIPIAKGAAAEALVLLAAGSGSGSNTASVLVEIKPECVSQFVSIISDEKGQHRNLIAKLLWNLLAHADADQYAHHLKKIHSTLPEILRVISLGVEELKGSGYPGERCAAHNNSEDPRNKQSKLVESFLGLGVQICTLTGATNDHFADALRSADLEAGHFVENLKEILVLHKSPNREFPGIRRAAVQLMICMMRNEESYAKEFVQRGVAKALHQVADTATKVESFALFYCGVGICKHGQPISSLVSVALALMAGSVEIECEA